VPVKGIESISCRDAPDTGTDLARYPANLKVGYRISGEVGYRISDEALSKTILDFFY
jgi:hypothetical protein